MDKIFVKTNEHWLFKTTIIFLAYIHRVKVYDSICS